LNRNLDLGILGLKKPERNDLTLRYNEYVH
jgi:hypothetical protein